MDFYRTGSAFSHCRDQWRGKCYPRGLNLYESARISSAVCRRWRRYILGIHELHFLMIYPAECNPAQDRCKHLDMWNEYGEEEEEESFSDSEDDSTSSQAEFKEIQAAKIDFFRTKFDRRLAMGDRFPTCDIFICMDERLQRGVNLDHLTHFKMAPWYLARCASTPRLHLSSAL